MKKLLTIWLYLLVSTSLLFSQGEVAGQPRIFFRNEKSVAFLLNTNGLGINGRYARRINARRKTIYEVDAVGIRHRKEIKQSTNYYPSNRSFVYGKANTFFDIRAGYGKQVEMFRKVDRGGISIRHFYAAGPAIGLLKPVYYEILYPSGANQQLSLVTEKFSADNNHGSIYGRASFFKGFNEISVVPGVFGKAGIMFEYSRNDITLHAIETGVMADIFPRRIPIMANKQNDFFFFGMFISYRFGNVFDARGIIDDKDLPY